MRLLTRYVIKEHLPPFFFALSVILFVLLMNFLLRYITTIFGKGISPRIIIELIFYQLAPMFALAVPMSVLTATLMAYGRLASDNEITIIKSSGINLFRIIRPALLFAIVIMAGMIYFNTIILPGANHKAVQLLRNIQQKKPMLKLEAGIFLNLDENRYGILVRSIEKSMTEKLNILGPETINLENTEKLKNITIIDRSNPEKVDVITAKNGSIVYLPDLEKFLFHLSDGEHHQYNNRDNKTYGRMPFKMENIYVDVSGFNYENKNLKHRSHHEMDISAMMHAIRINENEYAKHMVNDTLQRGINRNLMESLLITNQRYRIEIYKRFSIPFSALVFIIIGAPLGIRSGKGNLATGAAISIVFFLIFYIFLILGEELADRQIMSPFLAMWLPNIIVGLIGLYQTVSLTREKPMIFRRWKSGDTV